MSSLPERREACLDRVRRFQNERLDTRVSTSHAMELADVDLRHFAKHRPQVFTGVVLGEAGQFDLPDVRWRVEQRYALGAAQHHDPHVVRYLFAEQINDEAAFA